MTAHIYRNYLLLTLSLCVLVLTLFLAPSTSHAQEGETEQTASAIAEAVPVQDADWYTTETIPGGDYVVGDFVIGPGKIELELAPGESETVMISVTNRVGDLRKFNITVEDAVGSPDPTVAVKLLGNQVGPYTIKDYVHFDEDSLILPHNMRARIPVTISIPADAEPGGRYGSVLIDTVAVEREELDKGSLTSQSPIIARVGTLFFVTVKGETEKSGSLKDFTTIPNTQYFQKAPITFGILYENTGSIHLIPDGTLSITNMLGDEVGYVELESWFVMPKSLRIREVVWDRDVLLFGRYTATVEINRNYDDIVDTMDFSFWVLPWKIVLGGFTVLFVVLFLIKTFFRTFEFKRKE